VTRKTIILTALALTVGLVIGSYAGGEKTDESSSTVSGPETLTLDHLTEIYQPLEFSHGMHSLISEDCATCHHHSPAGLTPSCNKCHQVSAAQGASMPALKDAYHRQCIGCHKEAGTGPTGCMECHVKRVSKTQAESPTKKQVKKASQEGPESLTLSSLENRYQPVVFSHGMHVEIAEDCAACHHNSPAGQTPSCGDCHGEPFNPENLNMPGLKGAYHLQCMDCHKEIGGPVGCTECHAKKAAKATESKGR
jgi:hypothetical protein